MVMEEILGKQLRLHRSLEKFLENFKKIGKSNWSPPRLRSRISALKDLWGNYQEGHDYLVRESPTTSQTSTDYFKHSYYDDAEEIYHATLDSLTETLEELEPVVSPNHSFNANSTRIDPPASALPVLPAITLPQFSGNYEDWEHFRDRFTTLIRDNKELTNFARMHYLTSCLKGRASESISDLPTTADSFDLAWNTLTSRFEKKRRLLHGHLESLLTLPTVTREQAGDLQALLDKVRKTVALLHNLNRTNENLWNDILVHVVVQRLDPITRKAWNLKTGDSDEPPSYEALRDFLTRRINALDADASPTANALSSKNLKSVRVHASTTTPEAIPSCALCNEKHFLYSCAAFLNKTPTQRRDLVRVQNRCFNCLSTKHAVKECRSKFSCRVCRKKHHSLLHSAPDVSPQSANATSNSCSLSQPPPPPPSHEINSLIASMHLRERSHVILATAWVTVESSDRAIVARALIDQGSEMTFITENLAQTLRAKRIRMPVSISGVGGMQAGIVRSAANISISPQKTCTPKFATTALILRSLTSYAPKLTYDMGRFEHLAGIPWADANPTNSEPISVIIGADLYNDILLDGVRKGQRGQPIAQNSVFGWIISGPLGSVRESAQGLSVVRDEESVSAREVPKNSRYSVASHHCSNAASLDRTIRRFWEVEELPRSVPATADEEQCEAHFRDTHIRDSDGRYVVRLPFKKGPPIDIGESRNRAEKVLNSLRRRLQRNPEQEKEYREFLSEYEHLGHMRIASLPPRQVNQSVYIPHHAVVRESSSTTRLRVVFNASSVTSNGSTLNDHLLAGPKLQTEITAIILRWRNYKYVYAADIAKMYRQIRINERDVDYQRILWLDNQTAQTREYQLLTVTYGTACAPYLALRVLRQLIDDDGGKYPRAIPVLRDNTYVDDTLFGENDLEAARQTRNQVIALLQSGGFQLRKWASNSADLLSDIEEGDHGLACDKRLAADEKLNILGIGWNPSSDEFTFQVKLPPQIPETKRAILASIAKLYDPMGWVTPVIISAKIFMQTLWRRSLEWDDRIPPELMPQWRSIYINLEHLNGLRITRWTGLDSRQGRAELHGFADASNHAYAAAVYLKNVSAHNQVTVTLLMGKSRVAPLKPLSIPRLELSAAVLLANLVAFIRGSLGLEALPCYCWTDSTVTLAWVTQHPGRWKTFVANRVTEIQSTIPDVEWRHVDTTANPADCASRGISGREMPNHALWWRGPAWLRADKAHWPSALPASPADPEMLEEKTVSMLGIIATEQDELANRFSSWPKLIRVTAYMLRFARHCRRVNADQSLPGLALSAREICEARMRWIKRIQSASFPNEIRALKTQRGLATTSSIVSLHPFLDDDGVLRVGGRINKAPLPFDVRHPILLAPHPLVKLIAKQAHVRTLHAGLQLTLNVLRREFWIVHARNLVKSIIHDCIVCVRNRAAIPKQLMGDLPAPRVTAPTRCFLHCGVDYAGPILVRASAGRGILTRKAYIALFVCLATRAVHLEVVGDYSTKAFCDAFSRFCARRGLPHSMYSDNGTTFTGADKELTTAYRAAIRNPDFLNATASDQVTWNFIPPSAPHFSGFWEAGIRSVKHHLRRVIGKQTLTYEEMTTLLCRIEACLNSRPISPLTDTLDNYDSLTPGHFLIGSAMTVNPEPSLLHIPENRLSRWQLVRHLTERFWKIWQLDYVNTLQQRAKWRTVEPSLRIGQLVLLRNANLPPCKWELGRVIECHSGLDGLVRVVTVKTATSEFRRPITQLCTLPIHHETISN